MTSLYDKAAGQDYPHIMGAAQRALAGLPAAEYLPADSPLMPAGSTLQAACAVTQLSPGIFMPTLVAKTKTGRIVGAMQLVALRPDQTPAESRAAHRRAFVGLLELANDGTLTRAPPFFDLCFGEPKRIPSIAADLLARLGFDYAATERAFRLVRDRKLPVSKYREYGLAIALAGDSKAPGSIPSAIGDCIADLAQRIDYLHFTDRKAEPEPVKLKLAAPVAGEEAQQQAWLTGLEDGRSHSPLLLALAAVAGTHGQSSLQIEVRHAGQRTAAAAITVDPDKAQGHYERLASDSVVSSPVPPVAGPWPRGRSRP